MRSRCKVELKYLLALNKTGLFDSFAEEELHAIEASLQTFTDQDFQAIKEIEQTTRHDVKACEIFLRTKLNLRNENLIHFALTSEDVNNLAHSLLLEEYRTESQAKLHQRLLMRICSLASQWMDKPFPAFTHGQKASPTTAGKELAVFANRLLRIMKLIHSFRFAGKLNGAVGNFSAMKAAFPDYDWMEFSYKMIRELGLEPNIATTQIEDHDTWAQYFNLCRQINNIVMDLDLDCWQYISRDLFFERSKPGEVGSSTMPHKVNPINFENSEGNLSLSNALLSKMSNRLCRSRMQRDLSDSTVSRNVGTALSYAHLAISETIRGLDKLQLNEQNCIAHLEDSPELLAEPVQTILKIHGLEDPYNLLKAHTRGKKISLQELHEFIDSLDVNAKVKEELKNLRTRDYIGDAVRIGNTVIAQAEEFLQNQMKQAHAEQQS